MWKEKTLDDTESGGLKSSLKVVVKSTIRENLIGIGDRKNPN